MMKNYIFVGLMADTPKPILVVSRMLITEAPGWSLWPYLLYDFETFKVWIIFMLMFFYLKINNFLKKKGNSKALRQSDIHIEKIKIRSLFMPYTKIFHQ